MEDRLHPVAERLRECCAVTCLSVPGSCDAAQATAHLHAARAFTPVAAVGCNAGSHNFQALVLHVVTLLNDVPAVGAPSLPAPHCCAYTGRCCAPAAHSCPACTAAWLVLTDHGPLHGHGPRLASDNSHCAGQEQTRGGQRAPPGHERAARETRLLLFGPASGPSAASCSNLSHIQLLRCAGVRRCSLRTATLPQRCPPSLRSRPRCPSPSTWCSQVRASGLLPQPAGPAATAAAAAAAGVDCTAGYTGVEPDSGCSQGMSACTACRVHALPCRLQPAAGPTHTKGACNHCACGAEVRALT